MRTDKATPLRLRGRRETGDIRGGAALETGAARRLTRGKGVRRGGAAVDKGAKRARRRRVKRLGVPASNIKNTTKKTSSQTRFFVGEPSIADPFSYPAEIDSASVVQIGYYSLYLHLPFF